MSNRPGLHCRLLLIVALVSLAAWAANGADPEPGPAAGAPFAEGELLVGLQPGVDAAQLADLARTEGLAVIESYPATGLHRLRALNGDVAAAIARLQDSALVRFAEPNYRLRLSALIPDDPDYAAQAGYWDLLGAPEAWQISTGNRAVVVALIDGAVDLDHPDLVDNIWTNGGEAPDNGLDDDGNGFIDDLHGYDFVGSFAGGAGVISEDNDPDVKPGDSAAGDGIDQDQNGVPDGAVGHGTRVAGIIAAVGNNGIGVAGAAWAVSLMPLRVTDPEGSGYFSSLVRALEYAVANGAHIVNISLASPFLPESAQEAVDFALDAGLILVAAAGNGGLNVSFPAAILGVIAVGSHGTLSDPDARALFSPRRAGVDLVAPGIDVLSTDVEPISAAPSYAISTGTSFSAPFVSGALALVLSLNPTATAEQAIALILEGAVDLPDQDTPQWDGAGRLHLGRSLAAVQARAPAPPLINSVTATESAILVSGLAAPLSTVRLIDEASGLPLGATTATASGEFHLSLLRSAVPETTAVVRLVAVAESDAGPSAPSAALAFALPRSVRLGPGWNLVSWAGAGAAGDAVLATLPAAVERVFSWDNAAWQVGVPGHPLLTLPRIETGQGLWVFLGGEDEAVWEQERADFRPATLAPGWQLLAWTGASADLPDIIAASGAEIRAIFAGAAAQAAFRSYHTALPALATLDRLAHFDAVWVFVGDEGGIWPEPNADGAA